jgi:hypothetical protein
MLLNKDQFKASGSFKSDTPFIFTSPIFNITVDLCQVEDNVTYQLDGKSVGKLPDVTSIPKFKTTPKLCDELSKILLLLPPSS